MRKPTQYKECLYCKKTFSNKSGKSEQRGVVWLKTKFCSRTCMGLSHQKKVDLVCIYCKKVYQEIKSREKRSTTCSRQCADLKRRNRAIVKCRKCNSSFEARVSNIKRRFGVYCSQGCFAKDLSERYKGENGPGWKGGVSTINQTVRASSRYKKWRKSVFERDNYTCQTCGKTEVELQADHIKPFAYFPTLRFSLSNGRTLCVDCHKKTDTWGVNAKYQQAFSNI